MLTRQTRADLIGQHCSDVIALLPQGGVGLSGHDAACVGRVDGPLRARADGSRGGGALRPVRRAPCGVGRLRLHGEGVGPRDGGVSAHAAGTHQQSVLAAGTYAYTHTRVDTKCPPWCVQVS